MRLRVSSYVDSQYFDLWTPVLVVFGEDAVRLERQDCGRELGHGVHSFGKAANGALDVSGELRASVELVGEALRLLGGGHLAGEQKPQERLGTRLVARLSASRGQFFLKIGIVWPRKRMPSSASKRLVSHTMHFTLRAPPYAWFTVTSPRLLSPCSILIFLTRSCCSGTIASRRSFSATENERDCCFAAPRAAAERVQNRIASFVYEYNIFIVKGSLGLHEKVYIFL